MGGGKRKREGEKKEIMERKMGERRERKKEGEKEGRKRVGRKKGKRERERERVRKPLIYISSLSIIQSINHSTILFSKLVFNDLRNSIFSGICFK